MAQNRYCPVRVFEHFIKLCYNFTMKKIYLFLAVTLVFAGCLEFNPLPEPELPVVEVEITNAVYAGISNTITLTFTVSPGTNFDSVYQYYNKAGSFDMLSYITNKGLAIESTELVIEPSKLFVIKLAEGATKPDALNFNTTEPMYFGSSKNTIYNFPIVVAKGLIKTPSWTIP